MSANQDIFPQEAVDDTKNWIINNNKDIFPTKIDDQL